MILLPKWLHRTGLFFRANTVRIAMSVTVIAVMLILVMIAFEANKIQEQLAADNQILSSLETITGKLSNGATQRTAQYNELNRHLDCLAAFFAQPDRGNETISDIDTCTLQNNSTGATSVTTPKVSPKTNTESTQPTTSAISPLPSATPVKTQNVLDTILSPIKHIIKLL
jgi:hypothetical protein